MIDQELFDSLFKLSKGMGFQTFSMIPENNTSFPQVIIGDTQIIPTPNKNRLIGYVSATIHTWTRGSQRKEASTMTHLIYQKALNLKQTKNYYLNTQLKACQTRMLADNSTDTQLWHGIIELEYQFY